MRKEQYQHQTLLENVSSAQMIPFSNLYTYVPEETSFFRAENSQRGMDYGMDYSIFKPFYSYA